MSDPTSGPAPSDAKQRLTDAFRSGDVYCARQGVSEFLTENSSGRALRVIAGEIAQHGATLAGAKPIKIAVLSSYSAEFLADALTVALFLKGFVTTLYQAAFNQFRQEILDAGSGLYEFGPDVVILSVLGEHVCPLLYDQVPSLDGTSVEATINEFETLVREFRGRSSAPLLLQNLLPPTFPIFGVGDINLPSGQREQVHKINTGLQELCRAYPGVYLLDYEALVARQGAMAWHDERMRFFAQLPIDKRMFMPLAREYAKVVNILRGGAKKCIVVDLDNTLWGGVVGEDGVDGIKLDTVYPGSAYRAFQQALLALSERGILLAIASKNNPADVDEVFDRQPHMILTKDHFAATQVGWNPKSQSIEAIADELGISLEHIVFIDDNPVECAEVTRALPMVQTLLFPRQPENFARALAEDGLFDVLQFSAEDRDRTQLYKQRGAAETLRSKATDLEDFYRSLDMEIIIEPVRAGTLARTAQLTQKTNQLNLTTYRYSEADIAGRLTDRSWYCRTVTVRDRFGDNGIVGVVMAHHDDDRLVVDTFILSCRVIGRTVETAMLAHLCDIADELRVKCVEATLIPTSKNMPVRQLLPSHQFKQIGERDGGTIWQLAMDQRVCWPEWFQVSVAST